MWRRNHIQRTNQPELGIQSAKCKDAVPALNIHRPARILSPCHSQSVPTIGQEPGKVLSRLTKLNNKQLLHWREPVSWGTCISLCNISWLISNIHNVIKVQKKVSAFHRDFLWLPVELWQVRRLGVLNNLNWNYFLFVFLPLSPRQHPGVVKLKETWTNGPLCTRVIVTWPSGMWLWKTRVCTFAGKTTTPPCKPTSPSQCTVRKTFISDSLLRTGLPTLFPLSVWGITQQITPFALPVLWSQRLLLPMLWCLNQKSYCWAAPFLFFHHENWMLGSVVI